LSVVATACQIDIAPEEYVTPVPPLRRESTLAFVKYKLEEPSVTLSVSIEDKLDVGKVKPLCNIAVVITLSAT